MFSLFYDPIPVIILVNVHVMDRTELLIYVPLNSLIINKYKNKMRHIFYDHI